MTHNIETRIDEIHHALLTGEYKDLGGLLAQFEHEQNELERLPREDAQRLIEKAKRNEAHLRSAITGIKSGKRRAADILKAAQGLSTYDETGAQSFVRANQGVTRRV